MLFFSWGCGERAFLSFPGQLESLPMHSPPHTHFCPSQAVWDMSPVSGGMHFVSISENKAWKSHTCDGNSLSFCRDCPVWTPRITSLFQPGFCTFGASHLARKARLWLAAQVNQGVEQMISLVIKKFKRVKPSVSAWHPQGGCMLAESPRSQLLALQVQIRSIIRSPRVNQALGDWSPVIKLAKGWWINLAHHVRVRIKWERGHKAYLPLAWHI